MIYAIVMAGGRGTRLKVNVEKPLFKLHGKPLIKYVLDNISSSKLVEDVVIAVSSHTQETTKYLESLNGNFQILDTGLFKASRRQHQIAINSAKGIDIDKRRGFLEEVRF